MSCGNLQAGVSVNARDGGVWNNRHAINVSPTQAFTSLLTLSGFYRCSIPIGTIPAVNPTGVTYEQISNAIFRPANGFLLCLLRAEQNSGSQTAFIAGIRVRARYFPNGLATTKENTQEGYIGVIVNTSGSKIRVIREIRNACISDVKAQVLAEANKYFNANRNRQPPTQDISVGSSLSAVGLDFPKANVGDTFPILRYLSAVDTMRAFSPELRQGKWNLDVQAKYDTISYYAETVPEVNPRAPHIKLERVAFERFGESNAWLMRPTSLANAPIYDRGFTAFKVKYVDTQGSLGVKNFNWIVNTLGAVPRIIWIGYDIQGDALDQKIKELAYEFYDAYRNSPVSPNVQIQINPAYNIPTPVGYDSLYGPYVPGAPFDPGTELEQIPSDSELEINYGNYRAYENAYMGLWGELDSSNLDETWPRRFSIKQQPWSVGYPLTYGDNYELDFNQNPIYRWRIPKILEDGSFEVFRGSTDAYSLGELSDYNWASGPGGNNEFPIGYQQTFEAITLFYQHISNPNKKIFITYYFGYYKNGLVLINRGVNHSESKQIDVFNSLIDDFLNRAPKSGRNFVMNIDPPTSLETARPPTQTKSEYDDVVCNEHLFTPSITQDGNTWVIFIGEAPKCLGLTNRCLMLRHVNAPTGTPPKAKCILNIPMWQTSVAYDTSDLEDGVYEIYQSGFGVDEIERISGIIERHVKSNFDTPADDESAQTGKDTLKVNPLPTVFDEHDMGDETFDSGRCKTAVIF